LTALPVTFHALGKRVVIVVHREEAVSYVLFTEVVHGNTAVIVVVDGRVFSMSSRAAQSEITLSGTSSWTFPVSGVWQKL
jgi:hypothetical protein